jgi:hypothetical protein
MNSVSTVLEALPWFAWIPIVAIICGTIAGLVKTSITHRERMAMIRQGMHPDVPAAKPREEAEV